MSDIGHHLKEVQREEEINSLRMKLTHFTTFLRNVIIDLDEGVDAEKVSDDISEALGEGRPNGTEGE